MHLYQERKRIANKGLWLGVAVFAALLVLFILLFSRVMRSNDAREEALVESTLRRAAVTCYAIEGKYPESLPYLCEHYSVAVDESRYSVRYEIFGSNVMPSITVARKGGAS